MADKKTGPKFVTIDGEDYETVDVMYHDKNYTLRELSVHENDEIDDASKNEDGTYNGRLNLRLALAKSIVDPPTGIDAIEKWGGKKYLTLSRAYNTINSLPEGNA
jgi:hypothetical protein